jgi:hypothetical protein
MKGERTTWNIPNGDMLASDNQGNDLLRNKLLTPNGNDNTLISSPSLNLKGLALVARSTSLLA